MFFTLTKKKWLFKELFTKKVIFQKPKNGCCENHLWDLYF